MTEEKAASSAGGRKETAARGTALITGGSRGIGAAMSRAFFRAGWNVAINYFQHEERAMALAAELNGASQGRDQPNRAAVYQADVAVASQVREMLAAVRRDFGPVLCLVNNAGIAGQKLFTELTAEEWDRMFDVHVKGAFHCCQAVLPEMIRAKTGCVINVSSMWGQVGGSCETHYSAAKAALIGLTKALAKELGPSGVRVNCVAPGLIDTEMNAGLSSEELAAVVEEIPLGRSGKAEEVAALALYLASPAAAYLTGQVFGVNGGLVI